jgi:uncharacterized membrane protein
MLSNVVPPDTMAGMHINMTWDGIFHAFTWVITLAGIFMLWDAAQRPPEEGAHQTKSLVGGMVAGWGLFNVVEGVIDHHLLSLHNVREVTDPLPWNLGFLLAGAMMIILGWALMRTGEPRRIAVGKHTI